MKPAFRKITYAALLLLMLLMAIVGQKVHIFNEDPLHYAGFCGDLLPDNGASSEVVARCVVDDFFFFPCVCAESLNFETTFELLGPSLCVPVCSKQQDELTQASLRAPPVRA